MSAFLHSLFVIVATSILSEHYEVLKNPGFENPLGPEWTCLNCTRSWVNDSHSGDKSFLATGRTDRWQGPVQTVQLGKELTGGRIYNFSGYVKVLPSLRNQKPQTVIAGLNYTDVGPTGQAVSIVYTHNIEPADGWVLMEAQFYTFELNETNVNIAIVYPEPGVDFQVDTLSIVEVGKALPDDGILNNPGFENPIGGSGWFCNGDCTETRVNDSHTGYWACKVSDRKQFYHGPQQLLSLGTKAAVGSHVYKFIGYFKVLQSFQDQRPQNISASLHYQNTDEYAFIGHLHRVLPVDGWVQMEAEFYTWNFPRNQIRLWLTGPESGVDYLIDTMSITEIGATIPDSVDQVLRNPGFEKVIGGSGWFCSINCLETWVDDSHTGSKALKASGRHSSFNGPAQNLPLGSRVHGGQVYQFSGYVKVLPSLTNQRSQKLKAAISYTTTEGSGVAFDIVNLDRVRSTDGWLKMEGDFRCPEDGVGQMLFYINGPDAGVDFLIDTMSITET